MMLIIDTQNLTQEELDLLSALTGETKFKEPRVKHKAQKQELEPYYLEVITTCATCGYEHFQMFKMEWSCISGGLVSVEITDPVIVPTDKVKTERRQTRICSKCQVVLSRLPTDKLVDMIINLRKLS